MAQIKLSVVIPTCNRAVVLKEVLKTLKSQTLDVNQFEILVIDNGSTDHTNAVVTEFIQANPNLHVRCIYDPVPGLLTGRHRGLREARAELLSFIDDDVKLAPEWAASVVEAFQDSSVHLVGGPCLPDYDTSEIPSWVKFLWHPHVQGRFCPFYSLLDFGNKKVEVDPNMIWGLNFSIRKETLVAVGGFHPDCMPPSLLYLTGDGETAVTRAIKAQGLKAVYHPGVKVFHLVSKGRLTFEYVKKRAFYQGLTWSYFQYRIDRGLEKAEAEEARPFGNLNYLVRKIFERFERKLSPAYKNLRSMIDSEDRRGYDYHREKMKQIHGLAEWTLKKDYFEYTIPEEIIHHEA